MTQIKLYVASSWRNEYYHTFTVALKDEGFEILDWRNADTAFKWRQIALYEDKNCLVDFIDYRTKLRNHRRAREGFNADFTKMQKADQCVLLLPCGRSAHTEAGWFWGAKKPLHIYCPTEKLTPELMYMGATSIHHKMSGLVTDIRLAAV